MSNKSPSPDKQLHDADATGTPDVPTERFCPGCRTYHHEENMTRCPCGAWACLDCRDPRDGKCLADQCDALARYV